MLLLLLQGAQGPAQEAVGKAPWGALPHPTLVLHAALEPPAYTAPDPGAVVVSRAAGAPPCSGEVCQPRVAVPGYEPQYTIRGKRTELTLMVLDRLALEPLATVARFVARAGIRLDYTPRQLDLTEGPGSRSGWGKAQVLVRWRLDAWNEPLFAWR